MPPIFILVFIGFTERAIPGVRIGPFDLFAIWIWIFTGVFLALYVLYTDSDLPLNIQTVYLILFVVLGFYSATWSFSAQESVALSFRFGSSVVLLYTVVYLCNSKSDFDLVMYFVALLTFISLAVGAWELLTDNHLHASRLTRPSFQHVTAASAFYFNRNDYALLLSMLFPVAAFLSIASERRGRQLTGAVLAILVFAMLWINGSRAGMLGAISGGGFMLLAWLLRHRIRDIGVSFRIGTVSYAGFVLLSFSLPYLFQNPFDIVERSSAYYRWQLMEVGLRAISTHPLGIGIGNFPVYASKSSFYLREIYDPHNWATQVGAELGVLGLVVFVLLAGTVTDQLLAQFVHGDESWSLPLAASLIAFIAGGLSPSDALLHVRVFWVFLALSISYVILYQLEANGSEIGPPNTSNDHTG
jgi:hypothetical protein